MQKGHNTALIFIKSDNVLVHAEEIRSEAEYEVEMKIQQGSVSSTDPINQQ